MWPMGISRRLASTRRQKTSCKTSSASRGSGTRRRMKPRRRDCSRATTSEMRRSSSSAIGSRLAVWFTCLVDGEAGRILCGGSDNSQDGGRRDCREWRHGTGERDSAASNVVAGAARDRGPGGGGVPVRGLAGGRGAEGLAGAAARAGWVRGVAVSAVLGVCGQSAADRDGSGGGGGRG